MTMAVVQSAINVVPSGASSVTLGAAPTNGNLLICIGDLYAGNGAPIMGTGWTQLVWDTTGAGSYGGSFIAYKYAGAGESATQSPDTRGRNGLTIAMWEISGVSGTWASDFQDQHHNQGLTPSPGLTTTSWNTAAANQLVLGAILGNVDWFGSNQANPTMTNNGQTNAPGSTFNNSTAGNEKSCGAGFWRSVAGSGTAVQDTATFNQNQKGASYGYVSLNAGGGAGETGTAAMAFAGISFAAAGSIFFTASGPAVMSFAGIAFTGVGAASLAGVGGMAFHGISMNGAGLELGPPPGTGLRQFSSH